MKKLTVLITIISSFTQILFSQDCKLDLTITLKNIDGGFHTNQKVKLTSISTSKTFSNKSNSDGNVKFNLPCSDTYQVTITNYTRQKEIKVGNKSGQMSRVFSYPENMVSLQKEFTMSSTQKFSLKKFTSRLPDTLFLKSSKMPTPKNKNLYSSVSLRVKNLKNRPLQDELTTITGLNSKKSIVAKTDKNGLIKFYIPKGDIYYINFIHHKKYASFESYYNKGLSTIDVEYSYLGTKAYEKHKKEKEKRIAKEESRLKEEELEFSKYCESLGLTIEKCKKREIEDYIRNFNPNDETQIISKVLNRNNWKNKLIVCDLTGSMEPYIAELSIWYKLNLLTEKNLQFTFFNDGDNIDDNLKKIGETGGIYNNKVKDIESLNNLIAKITASGSGGDCEENDVEALIKATQTASPFNQLVLIADSNSPVRDIQLINKLSHPVHIILCGFDDYLLEDYLKIAWKTKGSIHTIEEDIFNIAQIGEGQTITINSITYKIIAGEFIRLE